MIPGTVEWRFSEPQPDWKPALPLLASKAADLERTTDALRVTLPKRTDNSTGSLQGGIYVELPDWRREEWAELVVRARTTGTVNSMGIGLKATTATTTGLTFQTRGGFTPTARSTPTESI